MTVAGKRGTGERVKELRERARLTQEQLAAFLEIDQSYLSKFESGERNLGITQLERLCELFGCRLEDLFSEDSVNPVIAFSFRSTGITSEDLEVISRINKIALNILEMQEVSERL